MAMAQFNNSKDHHFKTSHQLVRTKKRVFFLEDLNLQGLTKRNKPKQDKDGKYLPNNQAQKSGLNKSWLDAFFRTVWGYFVLHSRESWRTGCQGETRLYEPKKVATVMNIARKS